MGEYEKTFTKIGDVIPKIRIDLNGKQVETTCLRGTWSHYPDMIWKPEAWVCLEDFPAGQTVRWAFWFDEVHYIFEGKAELTYLLPATRFSIEKKMIVEKGDAYVIPKGSECIWKVDPSGPLKHLCVLMPAPEPYKLVQTPEGTGNPNTSEKK